MSSRHSKPRFETLDRQGISRRLLSAIVELTNETSAVDIVVISRSRDLSHLYILRLKERGWVYIAFAFLNTFLTMSPLDV